MMMKLIGSAANAFTGSFVLRNSVTFECSPLREQSCIDSEWVFSRVGITRIPRLTHLRINQEYVLHVHL